MKFQKGFAAKTARLKRPVQFTPTQPVNIAPPSGGGIKLAGANQPVPPNPKRFMSY